MHPQNTGTALIVIKTGCTEVACMEDFSDLYQAGLALEQLMGSESRFTESFNPDRDADEREREILELIKQVLRPEKAPDELLEKCFALIENM